MNNALMFGKASDEWSTPQDFWEALDEEFHFTFDAAASFENRKCAAYFGPDNETPLYRDALALRWATVGPIWLNPPYSQCRAFIGKAALRFPSVVIVFRA